MKTHRFIAFEAVLLGVVIGMVGAVSAQDGDAPFVIEIVNAPDAVPLGAAQQLIDTWGVVKGWVTFDVPVAVKLVGQSPLPVVPGSFWGYRDGEGLFSIFARVHDENGTEVRPCRPLGYAYDVLLSESRLEPGWTKWLDIPVCVPGVGRYVVEAVVEETASSYPNADGKILKLWTGSVASPAVTIEVTEPQGVDREAYEAFAGDPLGTSQRYGELLRRFPTSTYAAYVVWDLQVKGVATRNAEHMADSLALGLSHQWNSVPGPAGSWRSLSGCAYVEWRRSWLMTILEHHPAIWFGDEVRLQLAQDEYLVGNTEGCAAQLRDLAEHGRPYVAAKATELLAAMRAKDMLEAESP